MDPRVPPFLRGLPGVGAPTPLVLEVDLTRGVAVEPPSDPLSALRQRHVPLLHDVVRGLRRAVEDERVVAVAVHVADDVASAVADEIGLGIDALRAAGTPTYAFSESYGEAGAGTVPYALAARCDEVWLQPTGQVGLTGVAASITLAHGVFERLGVEPQFSRRHEYKTAADLFTATEVSDANREMTARLTESAAEEHLRVVAERRRLAPDDVRALVDRAPLSASEASGARLVDRLGYRDELDARLEERHPGAGRLYVHRYARRRERSPVAEVRRRKAPLVAVVGVRGPIVSGHGRSGGIGASTVGSEAVTAALRSARESERVAAVLLDVDSPGGSAVASDAIRREVHRVRESGRPVVAAMGRVAASGGYFVAMGADRVLALPTTLTGSIGVLAGKFVAEGLIDRVGLVRELVRTGENATMFSPDAPFTDAQRAQLEEWLDEIYEDFTRKAAEDRGMSREDLEKVARGRVWTGADALRHGLIDAVGGREAAAETACELAGRTRADVEVVGWPPLGLVDRLKPADSSRAPSAAVTRLAPTGLREQLAALGAAAGAPAGVLALPGHLELR